MPLLSPDDIHEKLHAIGSMLLVITVSDGKKMLSLSGVSLRFPP